MWLSSLFVVATVLLLVYQSTATLANIPDSLSLWLDTHPVPTQIATTPIRSSNRTLSPAVINLQKSRCPASCDKAGFSPSNWTVYHDVNRLELCNQTMLLDFTLYNSLNNPKTQISVRSCAASFAADASNVGSTSSETCPSKGNRTQVQESMYIAFNQTDRSGSLYDFTAATQQLERYLAQHEPGCNATIAFAYSGSAAVGIFAGSGTRSISANVLERFITEVQSVGISESVLVQLCADPERNRSSRYSLGIIANANADLGFVQDTVQTWASGYCVTAYNNLDTWQNVTLSVPSLQPNATSLQSNVTLSIGTRSFTRLERALAPRASADCTTVKVASGDTCTTLAAECGITAAEFTDYNPISTLCSTLTAGKYVCCSAGSLPDYAPSPYANGTCYTYLVVSGDSCSALAATYSITADDITDWNNNTWGWMGCNDLQAGDNLCLSSGSPPMPAAIANAVCGPQVPGTAVAPDGTNLSTLNQCPLNACCDIWGQCGTTAEFCTITESPTGAPGTAAAGTNGCISNCGTEIIIGSAPAEYMNVGYFEGFNLDRPCLNTPISSVDLSAYTHIHLAFATITTDFALDVSTIQDQFDDFLSMTGFKKIVSIGGWAFCTDPLTYFIFREAVTEANRDTFVSNIVAFVEDYELDGIDLDWEYPGEPDIPGIPAGTSADGVNYALFLSSLSASMPPGTTISVTAPASFWYLQSFLIQAMAIFIDYIVFMTYDLHGQWDYRNAFSDPGCPGGNCLRSDVNLTETIGALSMITKAGVPSNQVVVGVSSYGRSFQMTTAGCYTEMCTYVGPTSGAYAGSCTLTPGYIANAEINSIIDGNGTVLSADGAVIDVTRSPLTYLDSNSYSNIVVYDDTQWISYMDDSNKAVRRDLYEAYNFGGTADWAIDLQIYGTGGGEEDGVSIVYIDPIIFVEPSPEVAGMPPCTLVIPPSTMPTPTTISFAPIETWFVVGQTVITVVTPLAITTSVISFSNVPIESGLSSTAFAVTLSLKPQPLIVSAGGTSTTITFPAGPTALPGPEVVIVNQITYSVIDGSVAISSAGSGVEDLSIGVPPAKNTAQTLTLPNGLVLTIPATTPSTFYSLPTTVYTSNGMTQTFSEAQFTDLATITGQTTVTTTLTEVGYGSSSTATSTTVVAFWVAVGGFYWSPVPLPTWAPLKTPPIQIPSLPSFPEIPSPPCFKLFDIFSIDCPPDKSQPTTTFRSGPPSPTCKSGCGTLYTSDSSSQDDSSTSSSSSSSSSSTSFVLCSQGCSPCNAPAAEATIVPSKRDLERRFLTTPESYGGSVDAFMTTETTLATYPVLHGYGAEISTGLSAPFLNEQFTMALTGLYGCTSLIVISQQGVYMSHFWEDPSFESNANFQQQVIDVLANGYFSSSYLVQYALPPLLSLTSAGGILASTAKPAFLIFAPKKRGELISNPGLDPSAIPLMYEPMVSELQSFITVLTGMGSTVVEYDPDFQLQTGVTKYGKLLLQYDPAYNWILVDNCWQQQALARLYVEGASQDYDWLADANQIIPVAEAPSRVKKRQGGACLLSSPTATAADEQVTSTQPLPTQSTICLTSSLTGCSYVYQYVEAAVCTTTPPSFPASCTADPTTSSLPSLPTQCVTSSAVNCQWIYQNVDAADCPTTTTLLPASCTAAPTTTALTVPPSTTTLPPTTVTVTPWETPTADICVGDKTCTESGAGPACTSAVGALNPTMAYTDGTISCAGSSSVHCGVAISGPSNCAFLGSDIQIIWKGLVSQFGSCNCANIFFAGDCKVTVGILSVCSSNDIAEGIEVNNAIDDVSGAPFAYVMMPSGVGNGST